MLYYICTCIIILHKKNVCNSLKFGCLNQKTLHDPAAAKISKCRKCAYALCAEYKIINTNILIYNK